MEQNIIAVSQVNEYIKFLLDRDELLGNICVRGELSNYKVYPSGHHYFTLKDAEGALRCVMFRSSAQRLRFRPENGMQVIASGRVTVFPRDGAYQLYCNTLTADGAGDLYVAFEQLKEKLAKEGLFDPAHKKPIPKYPHTIAIITSAAGAAIMDMLRILGKRYPLTRVKLLPVRVQGAEAPAEIAGAIRYANRYQVADLIITGRGGGSMEDLWAFNDERVARAIYDSEIPVISAVGHEPDVTIADYVADLRAATPSNAAELAVPDKAELESRFARFESLLKSALTAKYERASARLAGVLSSRFFKSPETVITERRAERADKAADKLLSAYSALLSEKGGCLAEFAARLDTLSPLKTLARGYAVAIKSGETVRKAEELNDGDSITLKFTDGNVKCKVTEKEQTV